MYVLDSLIRYFRLSVCYKSCCWSEFLAVLNGFSVMFTLYIMHSLRGILAICVFLFCFRAD